MIISLLDKRVSFNNKDWFKIVFREYDNYEAIMLIPEDIDIDLDDADHRMIELRQKATLVLSRNPERGAYAALKNRYPDKWPNNKKEFIRLWNLIQPKESPCTYFH